MMKYKGRKAAALLLILVLLLTLAACQRAGEGVTLVEKPGEETVIRMYASGGRSSAFNQAKYWSENFKEETGINAVIRYDEESQYYDEEGQDGRTILRRRIESDQPDDMYIVYAEDMIDFARKGYLLDMTDFDFVDNLSDSARQLSTIDGRVYCLPLSYTGFGLYWNVDLLAKYDLEAPENYSELITVWDTLVANGVTPYAGNKGYALTVPAMCISLAEVYQSRDRDRLLEELATGAAPVSQYAREGFEFIKLMADKGYVIPQQALETAPRDPEEVELFVSGQAASVCATMGAPEYCDPAKIGFEVKMTGWPLLEDKSIAVVGTDQKLAINPATEHLDIVTAFVEMAGTEEALIKCTDIGKVSSGKKNDPSKYLKTEREFDELIQSSGQIPNTDMNLKLNIWENIRDISRKVLSDEITVDEACRLLDETQKADIANNRGQ